MTNPTRILRRHRILALGGAAVLALPLLIGAAAATQPTAQAAGVITEPQRNGPNFADIVAADKPAVVTITTRSHATETSSDQQQSPQLDPNSPYNQFFRQFFGDNGPMQAPQNQPGQITEALGSGFIVSPDGYIVTNNHVIDGASDVKVTLDDGSEYKGKVVGADPKSDLAVVKIDATSLPTMSWGDSEHLRAGDNVLAIGNPFGIGTTVTSGIVSARGRDLHNGPYDDFIQVDAAINHGNSGGPLVDETGKVVGINTAIYSPNGGNVGVGFAIPSNQAEAVVAKLEKGVQIQHGYIGVQIQPVTKEVADAIGLKSASGALISQIVDGSPASGTGLKTGDVVTAFNGATVATPHDLSRLVADAAPGNKDKLSVWRQGKEVDLSITVGQNKDEKVASAKPRGEVEPGSTKLDIPQIGVELAEITPAIRDAMGLDASVKGGIVASVDQDKAAADAGIERGDVVTSVNQKSVTSAKDVVQAVEDAAKNGRKSVLLEVERGDSQVFVGLSLGNA